MSTLLALDTASRYASVALYREDGLLAEQSWRSQNNQSVEVLPAIEQLLTMTGCTRHDLTAAAVAGGPGSFTGLRIGMSLAKGLCLALNIPIIAVPTLEITAYGAGDVGWPVLAVSEAGRSRLHVGAYVFVDGLPRLQGEITLQRSDAWAPDLSAPVFITGELSLALTERLLQLPGSENLALASPAGSARRAGYLAELAWYRLQAGEVDDLDTLGPLYQQQPLSGTG